MKVLMIHPFSKVGGVERWINEVSKRLNKKGYEILLSNDIPNFNGSKKKSYIWFKYKPTNDVDIIHLHEFSLNAIRMKGRIPIISTYHGSSWARFRLLGQKKAFISGIMEKIRYKFSDVNIVVSREVQRWYPNSIYIPNGVDYEKFNPKVRKLLKLSVDNINCIYVGRISYDKGSHELLKLRKISGRNGINIYISKEFGYIKYDDLPKFYKSFDVFVLPSLYEGMPLTALEAMACGLPVVAYRVGGLPDIVFDDFNGYLVKPGDITDFINKIKLAYENRKRLGRNGRLLVEKIFNWDYVTERYIEVYESLVSKRWTEKLI